MPGSLVWWFCDRCGGEGEAEDQQAAEGQVDTHRCRGWHGVVRHTPHDSDAVSYRRGIRD